MTYRYTITTGAAVAALLLGAQSVIACAGCGCAAKPKSCTPKTECASKAECKPKAECASKAGCKQKAECASKADCKQKAECASKSGCKPKAECTAKTCGTAGAADSATGINHLKTSELKELVENGNAIILDARSGKYDDGTRIPGAKSLNSKSSPEEIAAVIPSKDAVVVTYCSNTKCPASKMLAAKLVQLGYTGVNEYAEGIAGWKAAGGQVITTK